MSVKKLESGKYLVRVQVNNRRVKRTVRGNRKKAEEIEAKIRRDLHESDHNEFMGRAPKVTYGEACVKWGRSGAPESMFFHIRTTLEYLQDTQLTDVPEEVQNMVEVMLAEGLKNTTINRKLAVIKRVLNLSYKQWGYLNVPLGDKIQMLSEKNYSRKIWITPNQVDELLEKCPDRLVANFIMLAAYTGCRRSELLRAKKEDFKNGHLLIRTSKSGKPRVVPVPKELWPTCNALPFNLNVSKIRRNFEAAREAIGMPDLHLHDLRHSYGTWLMERGVSPAVVRDILGHSCLSMTSQYVHSAGIDIDEVLKR